MEKNVNITYSIITVCYNAEKEICETIESILKQTEQSFEYIIVDGSSTDDTLKIANEYAKDFDKKNITCKIYSEPDLGIYNAMNKGISYASGQWVNFMNAGDCFFDENVLINIKQQMDEDIDVIVGQTIVKDHQYYQKRICDNISLLTEMMPFCHQSVFVKGSLYKEYKFDEQFRIAADYDLLLRLYLQGKNFKLAHQTVAVYDLSGVSEASPRASREETIKVREKNNIHKKESRWKSVECMMIKIKIKNLITKIKEDAYYTKKRGWYTDIQKAENSK